MYIRGAYFVGKSTTANKLIDFFIVSPKNKVIYSRRKAEEGIFRFNTTIPGRYSFIFSNIKVRRGGSFIRGENFIGLTHNICRIANHLKM